MNVPTLLSKDDERQIEDAYRRYVPGYTGKLLEAVENDTPFDADSLGFWSFPYLFIVENHDEGVLSIKILDKDEYQRNGVEQYRPTYAAGWRGGMRIESVDIIPVTRNCALVEAGGVRHMPSGEAVNSWHGLYAYRRIGGEWRQFAGMILANAYPTTEQWRQWFASILNES